MKTMQKPWFRRLGLAAALLVGGTGAPGEFEDAPITTADYIVQGPSSSAAIEAIADVLARPGCRAADCSIAAIERKVGLG